MKKIQFLMFIALISATACADSDVVLVTHQVQYYVFCGDCNVTFKNKWGGISQENNVSTGWHHNFVGDPGQLLSITAQNNNDFGDIKVEIRHNGKLLKDAASSGAFVIASANGSIPD